MPSETLRQLLIRPARLEDSAAMLAIYAPFVLESHTSFEYEPPTVEEFKERVRKVLNRWAWLVAERDGEVVGYAYGGPHRERHGYRYSTETSAYIRADARGQGIGKRLYEALFPVLAEKGYCNAYAGIALPNDASIALHESIGFKRIGCFPAIGRKFGKWHDVAWFHRVLRADSPSDEP